MEHRYPSKEEIIDKYHYDGKQLHHLFRVEEFIKRFIDGESYADCLISKQADYLKKIKAQGFYTLEQARTLGEESLNRVIAMADKFREEHIETGNEEVDELLNDVQKEIMLIAIKKEINN